MQIERYNSCCDQHTFNLKLFQKFHLCGFSLCICREAPARVNNTVAALHNALHHPEVAIKLSTALKDDILMAMDRNPISLLNISAAFKHSQA